MSIEERIHEIAARTCAATAIRVADELLKTCDSLAHAGNDREACAARLLSESLQAAIRSVAHAESRHLERQQNYQLQQSKRKSLEVLDEGL